MPSGHLTARRGTAVALLFAALATAWLAVPGHAAPAAPARVSVIAAPFVSTGQAVDLGVSVDVPRGVRTMSIRVRIRDDGGRIVWQRTQTRRGLEPATQIVGFSREAAAEPLHEGRYRIEVRVRPGGGDPIEAAGRLLVVDPERRPVPVCVIVRIAGAPSRDASGAFVRDPGTSAAASAALELGRLAAARPQTPLALSVPPYLLDEWRDAADGYPAAAAAAPGVGAAAESSPSVDASRALGSLSAGIAAGGLELLGGAWGAPDLELLARTGATWDLREQLAAAAPVAGLLRASEGTGSAESTGFSTPGDRLPRESLRVLGAASVRFAVVSPASMDPARPERVPGGLYEASGTPGLRLLVVDEPLSSALTDPAGQDAAADALFSRLVSARATQPAVVVLEVGDGTLLEAEDLEARLGGLTRLPWVRLVSAAQAAGAPRAVRRTPASAPTTLTAAAASYRDAFVLARTRTRALVSAAGSKDPDAVSALRAVAMASGRRFTSAAAEGRAGDVAAGLDYAAAARAVADRTLGAIAVDVPPLTLPGSAGKVPVAVTNRSGKVIRVTLVPSSNRIRFPQAATRATLRPGETILEVPVDLGDSLSAPLRVELRAAGTVLTSGTATVRASYLDRLVIVGGVVLVLLVLLWFIRGRMRSALARRRERAED